MSKSKQKASEKKSESQNVTVVEGTLTTTTFLYAIKNTHPGDARIARLALEKGLGIVVKRTQDEITAEVERFRDVGEQPIEPYLNKHSALCYDLHHRGVFNVVSFEKDGSRNNDSTYSYSGVRSIH
jgi:hypothetical protein